MNFSEFLAKLGSATVKTLADARALLAECVTALGLAVTELEAKSSDLISANDQIATLSAKVENLAAANALFASDLAEANEKAATAVSGTLAALASAGLKVEQLDPAAIKSAVQARAESIGHELLAARGIKPIPEQLKPATEVEASLSTDAAILDKYQSMANGPERVAFLDKHADAIWRAHGGRR